MSVSFIVPVWREDVYARVCLPWIIEQMKNYDAELIEVRRANSIFESLEQGRQKANNRYLFYVHDDVRLIKPFDLTLQIVQAFTSLADTGLIGPVGKVESRRVPWWLNPGPYVGHYCRRAPNGEIMYQFAKDDGSMSHRRIDFTQDIADLNWNRFATAGLVDGFFLAEDRERVDVPWDLNTYGHNWHAYDMDRCFQTHALGLKVRVPHWLFLHDNAGHAGYKGTSEKRLRQKDHERRKIKSAGDKLWLTDLDIANAAFNAKWGMAP